MTDWLEWVLKMGTEEENREETDEGLTALGHSCPPTRPPVPDGPISGGEDGTPSGGMEGPPADGGEDSQAGRRGGDSASGTAGAPPGEVDRPTRQEDGGQEDGLAWDEETRETLLDGSRPPGRAFHTGRSLFREEERGGEDLAWRDEEGAIRPNRDPPLVWAGARAGDPEKETEKGGGSWRRSDRPGVVLPPRAGGAGELLERARQTRAAAEYAAGRREPVTVPVPVAAEGGGYGLGAGELDRVFQRDARRFDGAFTLY